MADNWSGIVLISQMIRDFTRGDREHTLQIIAFGKEEPGMIGSDAFLHQDGGKNVIAFVNLDTLGIGNLRADARSDPELLCLASAISRRLDVTMAVKYLAPITGDWKPFHDADIAFINFHSLDRTTLRLLHSPRDRLEMLDDERLAGAWRISAALVMNLGGITLRK